MSLRTRLLLLSRITRPALSAADAGATGASTGGLFTCSALLHDTAYSQLTRLSSALAVRSLSVGEDEQASQRLPDNPAQWERLLPRAAVPAAAVPASARHWSLELSVSPPLHRVECCTRSFASQSSPDRGGASADARRRQTDTAPAAERHLTGDDAAQRHSGWTQREVWNAPNAISMARLISGPVIAYWIMAGRMDVALPALVISGQPQYSYAEGKPQHLDRQWTGWSDWLDGYVARRFDQQSTLGSYLDPLADKVLICSVVAALGIQGPLPGYLAAVILGRDAFLVVASFAARARSLDWRRVSIAEFFRIVPKHQQEAGGAAAGVQGAGAVTPLYISKLNTVFQLMAVAGFLLHAQTGWPPLAVLKVAAAVTTGTTVLSGAAYIQAFRKGHL